jgi:hypothetical protein
MRWRGNDGQQRLHRVAAAGAVAHVGAQRGCDRDGVAGGTQRLQLFGDEAPDVVRLQLADHDRPVGELRQQ